MYGTLKIILYYWCEDALMKKINRVLTYFGFRLFVIQFFIRFFFQELNISKLKGKFGTNLSTVDALIFPIVGMVF